MTIKATEPFYKWLRRVYDVKAHLGMVTACDRDDGHLLGTWEEGGRVPEFMFERYLDEVDGAREDFEFTLKEHPEWASVYDH
jgi:hypothetical protein